MLGFWDSASASLEPILEDDDGAPGQILAWMMIGGECDAISGVTKVPDGLKT